MPQAPGPDVDLIEHAAGIIVAKMKEPHTAPYHWAGALWEAGMLHSPGSALDGELAPPNDVEATGRCCCSGCVGMGPCDRADSGRDDRGRCEHCAGTGTDSTLVATDPYPIYMPHPCGYCKPVKP